MAPHSDDADSKVLRTVLAELGRTDEAFSHLKAVHTLPVAHYNLGTLLCRRGQTQEAAQQFAQAATLDPSFTASRELAVRLGSPGPQSIPASYTPSGPDTAAVRPGGMAAPLGGSAAPVGR